MSRSAEFGAGALVKDGPDGPVRSAVAAVGNTDPKMRPPLETNPYEDPNSSYYGAAGSLVGPDLEYEKRYQRDND